MTMRIPEYETLAALRRAALRPCLLCGNEPAGAAMFTPVGISDRRIFYSLCASCLERPDKAKAAENVFRRQGAMDKRPPKNRPGWEAT
jgi:hypothetical protein